jgi:FtsP/CotA-like multicopper oxidase with cupredoxin domain
MSGEAKEGLAMRALPFRKARALLVLAVVSAGLLVTSSTASAAPVAVTLCAVPGNTTLTGAVSVPIWGFGVPTIAGDCSTATASLPGPVLEATVGDSVTVTVINGLPAGHTLSFEVPGIAFDPGPTSAAAGATVTRTFTAGAPGTYLYSSGGTAAGRPPRGSTAR